MSQLTDAEKEKLCALIRADEPLPAQWRAWLFPGSAKSPESGKEYRLVNEGKMRREDVLAQTLAAPWQLVRSFCAERPHADKRWPAPSDSRLGSNQNQLLFFDEID